MNQRLDEEDTQTLNKIYESYMRGLRKTYSKYSEHYIKAIEIEGKKRLMLLQDPITKKIIFNSPLEWLLVHNPLLFRMSSIDALKVFSDLENRIKANGSALKKVNPIYQENIKSMLEEIKDLMDKGWGDRKSRISEYFNYEMHRIEGLKEKDFNLYEQKKNELLELWQQDYAWMFDKEETDKCDQLFEDIFYQFATLDGLLQEKEIYSIGDDPDTYPFTTGKNPF